MRILPTLRLSLALLLTVLAAPTFVRTQDQVSPRARQVHERAIVIDSHDDTTQRLIFDKTFDLAKRNADGNVDIPRMRDGGLDALSLIHI